jgi:hypothetical protein
MSSPITEAPALRAGAMTAVVYVGTYPERYLVAVRSLLDRTDIDVVVGCLYTQFLPTFAGLGPRVEARMVGSVSELINVVYAERRTHIAAVNEPCVLPPDPFATALAWLGDDLRYSTVSFLSNAGDFLSFPVRNLPQDRAPDGTDEQSITRRLRSLTPAAQPPDRLSSSVRLRSVPLVRLSLLPRRGSTSRLPTSACGRAKRVSSTLLIRLRMFFVRATWPSKRSTPRSLPTTAVGCSTDTSRWWPSPTTRSAVATHRLPLPIRWLASRSTVCAF